MKNKLLVLAALFLFAVPAGAACNRTFFVDFVGGSDASDGLSIANAWQHAPGMPTFTGSYSTQTSDCFTFKGGVTWTNANFPYALPTSGTSSQHAIYGRDVTWFTGGSWTRPVFDGGDVCCKTGIVTISSKEWIQLDWLDLRNLRYAGNFGDAIINASLSVGGNLKMTNILAIGFKTTKANTGGVDMSNQGGIAITANGTGVTLEDSEVANGSHATLSGCAGFGTYNVPITRRTKIHNMAGGMNDPNTVDAVEIYDLCDPSWDPQKHIDIIIKNFGGFIFNSIFRDNNIPVQGSCLLMAPAGQGAGSQQVDMYNNTFWNNSCGGGDIALKISSQAEGDRTTFFVFNNTFHCGSSECITTSGSGFNILLVKVQNNHYITDFAGDPYCSTACGGAGEQTLVNTFNVKTSTSDAATQGYVAGNQYQPTDVTDDSVNVGTTDPCSTTCSDDNNDRLLVARPQGASWDVGSYEFIEGASAVTTISGTVKLSGAVKVQ